MDKLWYAIYTKPRWEKKVSQMLTDKGIENYLPLQKTLKQWSDRRKLVSEPLFRSYVFVCINHQEHLSTLQTPGVVKFITFERKAVPIPPLQIEAIRVFVDTGEEMLFDIPDIEIGDRVVVTRGVLKGLEGTLVQVSNKHRMRIMIEGIQQSLHLKMPASYLEKV
jgi:transcription antitermination factor NusG